MPESGSGPPPSLGFTDLHCSQNIQFGTSAVTFKIWGKHHESMDPGGVGAVQAAAAGGGEGTFF